MAVENTKERENQKESYKRKLGESERENQWNKKYRIGGRGDWLKEQERRLR